MSMKTKLINHEDAKLLYDDVRDRIEDTKEDVGDLSSALDNKANKADTVLTTTLSLGRKSNTTVGNNSTTLGNNNTASGERSLATGFTTVASGGNAVTEGYSTEASGPNSHAEGYDTTASGAYSHSDGKNTVASGESSRASGLGTVAAGRNSSAFGAYNVLDSYSDWPEWAASTQYAIGDKVKRTTTSSGVTTVAGYICKTANSDSTFTYSNWDDQNGKMNYAEIVGNGTANNARSNARTLDWDGNEELAGDLTVFKGTASETSLTTLKTVINQNNNVKITSFHSNGYIDLNGEVAEGANWYYTDYISAKYVASIYSKGYQYPSRVALVAFYDSNKVFISAINTYDGQTGEGTKEGTISVSGIPHNAVYMRFTSHIFATDRYVDVKYKIQDGNLYVSKFNPNGYIDASGVLVSGDSQSNWVYTDYISAENVLSISSKAYQYPGAVALVAFYDENKVFISAVDTYDGQTGKGEKEGNISIYKIPSNAKLMRFTCYASTADKYVNVKYNYTNILNEIVPDFNKLQTKTNTLENRLYGYPFKMSFIGDSLTAGQTYVHDNTTEGFYYNNKSNYPEIFCRMMDIDEKNVIAISGGRPGHIWNQKRTEVSNIEDQFVIVWLGTNGGLTDTVSTECVGDDVDSYADTNTGNYGKIIKTLVDNGNKVFLAQLCYTVELASNPVIVKLAERFGCYVISLTDDDIADLNQNKYHTAYNGYVNSVHFNSIGYNHVASIFFSKMMEIVYTNPAAFEIRMEDN